MWTLGRESHSQAKLIGPAVIVMTVLTLHPLVGSDTNNEIGGWDQSDSAEMRWKKIEIRVTCLTINCPNMRANLYGEGYFSHNETESITYIKLPNESFGLLTLESTTPFGCRILYTPVSSNISSEELTQYWVSYANQQSTKRTYTITENSGWNFEYFNGTENDEKRTEDRWKYVMGESEVKTISRGAWLTAEQDGRMKICSGIRTPNLMQS
ncbi:uncharacterized protein LOC134585345 [Pelobates fuscus]|uniref:uncharacterized protein LOC134585345 n=1 Tax=Pelobates fuscus TaxID=191477 RepID=UPI002FE4A4CD